jgi:hypothetical protein
VLNYIGFDVGGPDALAEWKTTLAAKDHRLAPGQAGRKVSSGRWLSSSSSRIPMVILWRYRMASRSTKSRCVTLGNLTSQLGPRAAHGQGHPAVARLLHRRVGLPLKRLGVHRRPYTFVLSALQRASSQYRFRALYAG